MLEWLCAFLRNWFDQRRIFGAFEIVDGSLDLTEFGAQDGQYIRIIGSTFNDGVYSYPVSGLTDETYDGAVWLMAVPPAVKSLAAQMDDWQAQNGGATQTPYLSESFAGYSYTKASGVDGGTFSAADAFKSQLDGLRRRYQKI